MPSELSIAFKGLDSVLADSQHLWLSQPFTADGVPWQRTHGHIYDALLALGDEQVLQLHDDPLQRRLWFQTLEPRLCDALYAFTPAAVPSLSSQSETVNNEQIPDRKWQQIVAFARELPHRQLPLVDWCAGKGHLSRVVQRDQQQSVHCVEWNPALVATGRLLAHQQRLDIHYHRHDVTQALPAACAEPAMMHIGLHACGELHHHLLHHVTRTKAQAVAFSPCCYHKISAAHYVPLSRTASETLLHLERPALHLALQDAGSGRLRERKLRALERLWRLGFDALQRDLCGSDHYLNVPSCKRELLRQGFPRFCQWAATEKQLVLPEGIDFDRYLALGRIRHRTVVRLDLLRQLFSRPLELWLVLDSALLLEEHGYRVTVTQFCQRHISPRNILIRGERG